MAIKNPFMVIENFLSPSLCEDVIFDMNCFIPSYSSNDQPIMQVVDVDESLEEFMMSKIRTRISSIEKHYDVSIDKIENISFEWMVDGCASTTPHSENADFIQRQWVKTRNFDFTGVLFLNSHCVATEDFDPSFEVLGGKLEFPQHHFGFQAQRGALVVFPSDPHFINLNSSVMAGELFQVRFQLSTTEPFIYNPKKFEGDYTKWFNH